MPRTDRLFEIIQILRASKIPLTADAMAQKLEVSTRTIYRDISTLQMMQTPIEGEAGIGYVMRRGYDLPPLNFDQEEIEALRVGLLLLARTGDSHLEKAATRIFEKVDALHGPADWLQVSPWGAPLDDPDLGCVSISSLRSAIRNEHKIRILYRSEAGAETRRVLRPFALSYRSSCILMAGWCELRGGLRHFRTDRIYECEPLEDTFTGEGDVLRRLWLEHNELHRDEVHH